MKIAVYVGSFNPVHKGHIAIAKHLINNNYIDKIIIVPTYLNPFKNSFYLNPVTRFELLKKVFPVCSTFTSPIPTYPGGYWAWAFCSESVKPLSYFADDRYEDIVKTCKIYNRDYHNARFALPNYLKELL